MTVGFSMSISFVLLLDFKEGQFCSFVFLRIFKDGQFYSVMRFQ